MNFRQQCTLAISGSLLALTPLFTVVPEAIAQSCVAATSCTAQPLRVPPGKWVEFKIINNTSAIISIEQPGSLEAIALSPGQRLTLQGSTKDNVSFLFWDAQGSNVEARLSEPEDDNVQVELVRGNGLSHSSVYLRDDGLIEVF